MQRGHTATSDEAVQNDGVQRCAGHSAASSAWNDMMKQKA